MKYAIVVMDGAADEPLAELDGLTPLAKAHIPQTDQLSIEGRQGLVRNIPNGFPPGSDVALMSVLGYDPKTYYTGRAPLEAAAQGIETAATDWIFRCNLVTVADGIMEDYSAGHISTPQAGEIIKDLQAKLGNETITFHAGVGYRHLMVYKGGEFDLELTPPHDITEKPIAKYLPKGKQGKVLRNIMEQAAAILADHPVNHVRRDLDENPATSIWLWGQGHRPQFVSFLKRFGLSGAVITAVDLMRGLGRLAGMELVEVKGATGYLDTNYAGKGAAAVEALKRHDLVVVHVEAPDEAGHGALVTEKIKAIEMIDQHIVGPLRKWLGGQEAWRLMVLPDHPTPIRLRTHTADAVPFALAGSDISPGQQLPYTEANAERSGFRIDRGHEMMEYFLNIAPKTA